MEQVNKFLCWRCGLPINLAIRFMVSDKGLSHEDCWQAQHDRINDLEKALKNAEEILLIWECEGTLGEGGEELAKIVRDALKGEK